MSMCIYVLTLSISLFLNLSALVVYHQSRRHLQSTVTTATSSHSVEYSLLVYSLAMLVSMILLTAFQVLIAVYAVQAKSATIRLISSHFTWIIEIFSLCSPWILVCCSKAVRQLLRNNITLISNACISIIRRLVRIRINKTIERININRHHRLNRIGVINVDIIDNNHDDQPKLESVL